MNVPLFNETKMRTGFPLNHYLPSLTCLFEFTRCFALLAITIFLLAIIPESRAVAREVCDCEYCASELLSEDCVLFENENSKSDHNAKKNTGPKPAAPQLAMPEPSNVLSIVRMILDEQASDVEREQAIKDHPDLAPDLITTMVSDLKSGTRQESSRIPWIWKVAAHASKQNDSELLARVLDAGLPMEGENLSCWQATVIGGGIISGLSEQGFWPAQRVNDIVAEDAFLKERWERTIRLANRMVEDRSFPNGTRYDALRILAMQPWQQSGQTLAAMMQDDVEPELQLGAVRGAIDSPHPESGRLLASAIPTLTYANREIAIDGLLRTKQRIRLLGEAIADGEIDANWLTAQQTDAFAKLTEDR